MTDEKETLPDAPEEWLCKECNSIHVNPLYATNPFDKEDYIIGCPSCKEINTLEQACQYKGCTRLSTAGIPNIYGYRYLWVCSEHIPFDRKR
jgi:hypothetical protein